MQPLQPVRWPPATPPAAINRLDGRQYAVKKIPLDAHSAGAYARIMREVTTLSRLQHVNVVRYFQVRQVACGVGAGCFEVQAWLWRCGSVPSFQGSARGCHHLCYLVAVDGKSCSTASLDPPLAISSTALAPLPCCPPCQTQAWVEASSAAHDDSDDSELDEWGSESVTPTPRSPAGPPPPGPSLAARGGAAAGGRF